MSRGRWNVKQPVYVCWRDFPQDLWDLGVSPVPVTTDYSALTVGLQSSKGLEVGGGGTRVQKLKERHCSSSFKLPFFPFLFVSSVFSEISPLCFSLLLPTGLFSFFPCATFSLYSSQTVCEMRGFRLPAWNRCGSMHQPIKKQCCQSTPYCSKSQSEPKMQPRKHKHMPENWTC